MSADRRPQMPWDIVKTKTKLPDVNLALTLLLFAVPNLVTSMLLKWVSWTMAIVAGLLFAIRVFVYFTEIIPLLKRAISPGDLKPLADFLRFATIFLTVLIIGFAASVWAVSLLHTSSSPHKGLPWGTGIL